MEQGAHVRRHADAACEREAVEDDAQEPGDLRRVDVVADLAARLALPHPLEQESLNLCVALFPRLEELRIGPHHWADALSFPLLLALVFALGLFSAPYYAAQRTIVPELFGEDEAVVAQASALFGGATHVTMVAGPALGGLLVAWLGAPAVLLVDAATYLVAFVLVIGFVRAGARVEGAEQRGLLAGVRYLARDRILGPMTLTVILLDMCGSALFVSLPALAFLRFDRNPHVAGWLFAAF